ncbi:MAG: CehA/McbA family metallohydrolase, partial [Actinocatenispora sp.]
MADGQTERTETIVLTGHLDPGAPDLVYLPVRVPDGVRQIEASYTYDRPAVADGAQGNACDLGVFDARGTGEGFRGWSGGARDRFTISPTTATPGYLPGPVTPGVWHVALAPYTVAPQGMDYRVEVTLSHGEAGAAYRPDHPPLSAAGRGRAWYRGDCHLHTVYSDGRRTPGEMAAEARAAGLDFITSTEHNTPSAHGAWGPHAGPDLLVMLGEEVTTRNGHWLALGLHPGQWIDWRYRSRDGVLARHQDEVHESGGLCVVAHPFGPCYACSFRFSYRGFDAVEVWNGEWTPDDEMAVAEWDRGLVASLHDAGPGPGWLPAMGNSDTHDVSGPVGLPQTVVLADGLSRDEILAGIRAGHSWIAESAAVDVALTAEGPDGRRVGIGDRLDAAPDDPVTVRLDVRGVPSGTVRLLTDEGESLRYPLPDADTHTVSWSTTPAIAAYVRAEVRHTEPSATLDPRFGRMAALTNPIFLGG